MAPRGALGQEAKPGARIKHQPLFLGHGAQPLITLKLVGLHLTPERSEISPHPWASYLWQPSSFLGRWARAEKAESIGGEEEVWIVETMAVVGRKTTWSGQAEAGVEEKEAWIVTSPMHPSLDGSQLGRTSWSGVFS